MLNNSKTYICVEAEIHCRWNEEPPVYRAYVNDELFTERTFIWTDCYLIETLQLAVAPGKYQIRVEKIGNNSADFEVRQLKVAQGPAKFKSGGLLKVGHENT
jgi:hypothetical protein